MALTEGPELFEAARRASVAVPVFGEEGFAGMRTAGRLAAEVLDLLVPKVQPGVTTADLDKLAQLRPGASVRFEQVANQAAEELYRRRQQDLRNWLLRIRTAVGRDL